MKLIWDVISAIHIGKTGEAFVLDGVGRLVAHPDISLVLRGADNAAIAPLRALQRLRALKGGRRPWIRRIEAALFRVDFIRNGP